LGTGYGPIAPGTWGSAAVAGIYLAVAQAVTCCFHAPIVAMVLVAIVSSIICVALGPFAERHFGTKDPGQVTIDEWAGQAVALMCLPAATGGRLLWTVAAAFVAFRVFDIVKPPPVRALEKLPSGWGVLADDLAAGVYANIVCQILFRGVLG
jgi:phosphatidylglycerophosphatase A